MFHIDLRNQKGAIVQEIGVSQVVLRETQAGLLQGTNYDLLFFYKESGAVDRNYFRNLLLRAVDFSSMKAGENASLFRPDHFQNS